ncbi:hypothetical protein PF011_g16960 [Phytophthora fragariae]|uniref:Uncharacterized protein n=1 Tax=Phytophthora fragariae TaxID=53985 RepID=A0A6A3JN94_9STRA|nr:hypothetical protein PF011_g16960 [Phytophthora fragariae]
MQPSPAPLAGAAVVCRSQLHLAALPHISEAISGFLDCTVHWSLPAACGFALELGALRLVQRVAAHEAVAVARARRTVATAQNPRISDKTLEISEAKRVLRQHEDQFFRQQQFTLAMARAAARGDMRVMQWLVQQFPGCYVTRAVEEAAKHGQLMVLQWLQSSSRAGHIRDDGGGLRVFWGAKELFYAGQNGRLDVVQWLQEHTHPAPTHMFFVTLEEAARNGDLPMVQWLCDVRGEWSPYAAVLAASGGHLHVLKWLRGNIFSSSPSASMDDAAANGHFEVLKWMQANGGYATSAAMNKAAGNGHLEIVKWLHKTRAEGCTTAAMDAAAANGHVEIVQWLQTHRREGCTKSAMDEAATRGHLSIVQWLHQKRREGCTTRAMDGAAMNGHLAVEGRLHDRCDGPSSSSRSSGCCAVVAQAPIGGLERVEGCTAKAFVNATSADELEILQWLFEHYRSQFGHDRLQLFAVGKFYTLQWLKQESILEDLPESERHYD